MATYLGLALLNGPAGAADTPEKFLPKICEGAVPTEFALVISAQSLEEAREKQILWHCVMARKCRLQSTPAPLRYQEGRKTHWLCSIG
jgi:hypothetical protein